MPAPPPSSGAGLALVRRYGQFHTVENLTGTSDFPFPLFFPSSCLSPIWTSSTEDRMSERIVQRNPITMQGRQPRPCGPADHARPSCSDRVRSPCLSVHGAQCRSACQNVLSSPSSSSARSPPQLQTLRALPEACHDWPRGHQQHQP